MADERVYMNTVNGWDKMDAAVTANAEEVPQLEINLGKLRQKSALVRNLYVQHAALAAARQGVTQEMQQLIEEGESLVRFLREGVKAHYGKRSEKLVEFGVQPLRSRTRKKASEPPPLPETVSPATAPDSVK
ncbi:MAG TPA: hypothetical protein VN493_06550 [Thermoanaerobaculia bacterium]|nr:hypothetical protein [Thermoanaerobaculia bacterium]